MFVYNIKLDSKNIVKVVFVVLCIIITLFFIYSTYQIITESFRVQDEVPVPDVQVLTTGNYANVLRVVYNNLQDYLGIHVSFTGYVYRQSDFPPDEFVLARNLVVSDTDIFILGFLCRYPDISNIPDGTWIEITGEISEGTYNGQIPIVIVNELKQIEAPTEDIYLQPPDNAYIPTMLLF
ncbi:MAG: hypothetical protein FWC79_05575 [Oscillospiraceae bacterium]|nr:hypothetical protein [Oscillospiraceae bacterium]